ncbi:ground-like domain protein [Cooperia oncophora]
MIPNRLINILVDSVCCDGTLQYEMYRAIDETTQRNEGRQMDREALAKEVWRNVQRRFNTTFEAVVVPSDFVWRTHVQTVNLCKINRDGFHALLFESSKDVKKRLLPPSKR